MCKACSAACSTCTGPRAVDCYTCPGAEHLQTAGSHGHDVEEDGKHAGECVNACSNFYFEAIDPSHLGQAQPRVCKKCSTSCGSECTSHKSTDCITCNADTNADILQRGIGQREHGECISRAACAAMEASSYVGRATEDGTQEECLPCTSCLLGTSYEIAECTVKQTGCALSHHHRVPIPTGTSKRKQQRSQPTACANGA